MKLKQQMLTFLQDEEEREILLFNIPFIKILLKDGYVIVAEITQKHLFQPLFLFCQKDQSVPFLFVTDSSKLKQFFQEIDKTGYLTMSNIKDQLKDLLQTELTNMIDTIDLEDYDYLISEEKEDLDQKVSEYIAEFHLPQPDKLLYESEIADALSFSTQFMEPILKIVQDPYDFVYDKIIDFLNHHNAFLLKCVKFAYVYQNVKKQLPEGSDKTLCEARDQIFDIFENKMYKKVIVTYVTKDGTLKTTQLKCQSASLLQIPYFCIQQTSYRGKIIYEQDAKTVQSWNETDGLWLGHFSTSNPLIANDKKTLYEMFEEDNICFTILPAVLLKRPDFLAELTARTIRLPIDLFRELEQSQWTTLFKELIKRINFDNEWWIEGQLKDILSKSIIWYIEKEKKDERDVIFEITKPEEIKLLGKLNFMAVKYVNQPWIQDPAIVDAIFEAYPPGCSLFLTFCLSQFKDNPYLVHKLESYAVKRYRKGFWDHQSWGIDRFPLKGASRIPFLLDEEKAGLQMLLDETKSQEFALTLCQIGYSLFSFPQVPMDSSFLIRYLDEIENYDVPALQKVPMESWKNPDCIWKLYLSFLDDPSIFQNLFEKVKDYGKKNGIDLPHLIRKYYKDTEEPMVLKYGKWQEISLVLEEQPTRILHHVPDLSVDQSTFFDFLIKHESSFVSMWKDYMDDKKNFDGFLVVEFNNHSFIDVSKQQFLLEHPIYYHFLYPGIQINMDLIQKLYDKIDLVSSWKRNEDRFPFASFSQKDQEKMLAWKEFYLKQAELSPVLVLDIMERFSTLKKLEDPFTEKLYTNSEFLLQLLERNPNSLNHLRKSHPCWKDQDFAKEAVKINPNLKERFPKRIQATLS